MNADQVHVASYSPVQQAWHVESLQDHVASNAGCLARGVLGDTAYCAIALAANQDEAHEAIVKIERLLAGKERRAGA